ncbi:unnamed protein product [Aphanomyces euteiches]
MAPWCPSAPAPTTMSTPMPNPTSQPTTTSATPQLAQQTTSSTTTSATPRLTLQTTSGTTTSATPQLMPQTTSSTTTTASSPEVTLPPSTNSPTSAPSEGSNSSATIGSVTSSDSSKSDNNTLIIVLTITGGVVLIAIVIGIVIVKRRRRVEPPVTLPRQSPPYVQDVIGPKLQLRSMKIKTNTNLTATTSSSDDANTNHRNEQQLIMGNLEMYKISPSDISIIKPLASGAYGEVLMAQLHGNLVAVKRLTPSKRSNMGDLVKFLDEINLNALIDCESIVRFIGASWTTPADVVMVSELMDQGDLRDLLQSSNQSMFKWPDKVQCAASIAHALIYLHSLDPKVVHRDLKSRNVLLNSSMEFKVTDFGVSRQFDDFETLTAGVGTFRWMAPEVLQDGHYAEPADVYSFGVILTELSTHKIPYSDVRNDRDNPLTDTAIMARVMNGNLMPTFAADCPPWFSRLGKRCLAFDVDDRPSAMEVFHIIQIELRNLR